VDLRSRLTFFSHNHQFSSGVAANTCFRGEFAAFAIGGFHRVRGGGSKILLTEAQLLPLRLEGYSSGSRRWQQISMF
jgi:hypothetical protein